MTLSKGCKGVRKRALVYLGEKAFHPGRRNSQCKASRQECAVLQADDQGSSCRCGGSEGRAAGDESQRERGSLSKELCSLLCVRWGVVVGFEQGAIRSDLDRIRFILTLQWRGARGQRGGKETGRLPAAFQAKERGLGPE